MAQVSDAYLTSPAILRQIRRQIDIRGILSGRWGKPHGGTVDRCCPFHEEKTASFRANLPGHQHAGRWRCHGCNEAGDVFDIVCRCDNVSMNAAIKTLAVLAGVQLEGEFPETAEDRRKRAMLAEEMAVAEWFFRERWKMFRQALDREMASGPPEIGSERAAEFAGQMMRWIAVNHGSDLGLKAFRASGGYSRYFGAFREYHESRRNRRSDWLAWLSASGRF